MSRDEMKMPGYLKFAWMFFMQPLSLHATLRACGIDDPNLTGSRYLTNRQLRRDHSDYLKRLIAILLGIPVVFLMLTSIHLLPHGPFLLNMGHDTVVFHANLALIIRLALGVAFGVALGITVAVAFAVVLGVAFGVVGSMAFPVAFAIGDVAFSVAFSVAFGVAFGVAAAVAAAVDRGIARGVAKNVVRKEVPAVAIGIAGGVAATVIGGVSLTGVNGVAWIGGFAITFIVALLLGSAIGAAGGVAIPVAITAALGMVVGSSVAIAVDMAGGVARGVAEIVAFGATFSVAFAVAFGLAYLRLPFWLIEVGYQTMLFTLAGRAGKKLSSAPIFFHELSYLPIPYLEAHIVEAGTTDPIITGKALEICQKIPGQRSIVARARQKLVPKELQAAARTGDFLAIKEYRGQWIPVAGGDDPLVDRFVSVAGFYSAARHSKLPYESIKHLDRGLRELDGLMVQLPEPRSVRNEYQLAVADWKTWGLNLRAEKEALALVTIPNPFRAGPALDQDLGWEVFRGREEQTRQVERLLADPDNPLSMALLGPRRSGKTSMLKMLPRMVPDGVFVFFDLQDNPADSVAMFFRLLAEQARKQARATRGLTLPDLPEGSPFDAAKQWLTALETAAGENRILLCIDEFERLETLFPGDRQDLLKLLGLIRGTIQHNRVVRFLVSGVTSFDELDRIWDDHFINLREIRLGPLSRQESVELLTRPIPEFPEDVIPAEVAEQIYSRTGGQPYLLQLFGSLLVNRLNDSKRSAANLEDLTGVELEVLDQGAAYLRDTVLRVPEDVKAALEEIASGKEPQLSSKTRRWMERRCLLDHEGTLMIPLLKEFIIREVL